MTYIGHANILQLLQTVLCNRAICYKLITLLLTILF